MIIRVQFGFYSFYASFFSFSQLIPCSNFALWWQPPWIFNIQKSPDILAKEHSIQVYCQRVQIRIFLIAMQFPQDPIVAELGSAYCLMNSEQFGWWTVYILISYPVGFLPLYSLADSSEIHIKAIYGQYLGPNINSCLLFFFLVMPLEDVKKGENVIVRALRDSNHMQTHFYEQF